MALFRGFNPHNTYPLLIFSWGILAWGVAPLLALNTLLAQIFSAVAVSLAGIATIVAMVQTWRHG